MITSSLGYPKKTTATKQVTNNSNRDWIKKGVAWSHSDISSIYTSCNYSDTKLVIVKVLGKTVKLETCVRCQL